MRAVISAGFVLGGVLLGLLAGCQQSGTVEAVKTIIVPVERTVEVPVEVITTQEVVVVETQVVTQNVPEFSTSHPILGDLRVRQAIAHCTDKTELIHAVYPLLTPEMTQSLVMDSLLPPSHWAYLSGNNLARYPFDLDKSIALLEVAGWSLASNRPYRLNHRGEELALKIFFPRADYRENWTAIWEEQLKQCGIRLMRFPVPADWWFGSTSGLARRDFELGALASETSLDPRYENQWSCFSIPLPQNNWQGRNYSGFCDEEATRAADELGQTLDRPAQRSWYWQLQRAFADSLPALPLFSRPQAYAVSSDLNGFNPLPGEPFYTYNAGKWTLPERRPLTIALTREPAALSSLLEESFSGYLVLNLIGAGPRHYTSLNYDIQAAHWKQVPTLENGLVRFETVTVQEGDQVVDIHGEVVTLQPGVVVLSWDGEPVAYQGTPLEMSQLVVEYEYRSDLRWPDGKLIQPGDIELGFRASCERREPGVFAESCQRLAHYSVEGLTATRTFLPGDVDPLYYNGDFPIYPAHRILRIGRRLGEVPVDQWSSVRQLREEPWGFGPYQIRVWVRSERITLDTHPYWYGGKPRISSLTLLFTTPAQAEAQLLQGRVDVLGPDTLAGLTPTLMAAQQTGQVQVFILPGDRWERVDMALYIR